MPFQKPPTITELPTEDWDRLDQAVRNFETAWQSGTMPDIAEFAPKDARIRALAISELVRVDLELRLKAADDGTRLESYLKRFPELNDPDRLTALAAWEFQLRSRHRPPPSPEEYARRFPHLAGRFAGWMMPTLTEALPPKVAPSAPRMPDIQGFQFFEELGRGGVGVVYRAKELTLGRDVAVKMILAGAQAGPQTRERLRNEATALARLRHPNIVPVYEVGEHDGLPFVVLEYVAGGSISKFQIGRPLPIPVAVAWMESIARAVQHAHEAGIIHRDIKPANVLLQWPKNAPRPAVGTDMPDVETLLTWIPRLTDFGLAKQLENLTEATPSGAMLGTPGYMAPEQAEGHSRKVGPAADIFALGAVLYELLTGRSPFFAESVIDTLLQVIKAEPIPPSRLRPGLPPDLEQICLKCLNKAPEKRYASAAAFAEDLERFRTRRPVLARPATPVERLIKWVRRYPAAAALIAVAQIALVVISILFVMAEYQRRTAEQALEINQVTQALKAMDDGERFAAFAAFVQILDHSRDSARAEMHRLRVTGLFRRPPRLVRMVGNNERINVVMFDQSGQVLLTAGENGARAWNPATGALRATMQTGDEVKAITMDATGTRAATASLDGKARIWDLSTGQAIGKPRLHGETLASIAFTPDAKWLLTVGRDDTGQSAARLWPVDGEGATFTLPNTDGVRCAIIMPGGQQVLTAGGDGVARLWDISPPPSIGGPALKHGPGLETVTTRADGKEVLTAGADGVMRRWNPVSGEPIGAVFRQGDPVRKAIYQPGGTRLVTVGDRGIRLWDLANDPPTSVFGVEGDLPLNAAFSNDGRMLVVATGQLVRVWDANSASPQPMSDKMRHTGEVRSIAFSPTGTTLATGATDGLARIWDLLGDEPITYPHGDVVRQAEYSADGQQIITAGDDKSAKIWAADSGRQNGDALQHDEKVIAASFSSDGRHVLTGSYDGTIIIWDAITNRVLHRINAHSEQVSRAVFSPDGRLALSASGDGTAKLWDVETGKQVGPDLKHENYVLHAAFGRDGKRVVTASLDGTAAVWDVATGKRLVSVAHPPEVLFADLDPTGQWLFTTGRDGTARIWDARNGNAHGEPLRHDNAVMFADFDPKGKWVVTASADGTARIWDLESGGRLGAVMTHRGGVFRVAVSPNGRLIATGSTDGTARVWDAQTGFAITPPLGHAGSVRSVNFRNDGSALLTGSDDGKAKSWNLALDKRSIDDWKRWATLLTGYRYDLNRGDEPLGTEDALQMWRMVAPSNP